MHIDEDMDVATLECLSDHLLHGSDLRGQLRAWLAPLAIQVKARQATSVIAHDDAIWVEHGNHLKDESVA
jgi:hypothetical protein